LPLKKRFQLEIHMKQLTLKTKCVLTIAMAGVLAMGPAFADKPSWAGGGKNDKSEQRDKSDHDKGGQRGDKGGQRGNDARSSHDKAGPSGRTNERFDDRHRTIAHDYYSNQFRSGHCPPGLAKKNNGCMPPGQAKKWAVGRALPRDVIYYEVPPALVVQFGQPRAGHRYVRVASDILLIAIGTGMVIDAMQDLGRM
jgi:Ni/Co efflux regulator RcnB